MKLEFIKPFASVCDVHFHVKSDGAGSNVTWSMDGTNNMMGKVMSLFMNMDKMVGKDFENGLAKLKELSETSAAATPAAGAPTAQATQGN